MTIAQVLENKETTGYSSKSISESIERFLLMEARMLDMEQYSEWFELMTEDIHYWSPALHNRIVADKEGVISRDRMAFFDDRYIDLQRRVERFKQPTAWTENPRIRHVHVISNIESFATENPDEFVAHSVFVNYRSSRETDVDCLFGRRKDLLRVNGDGFKIARRTILLAQNVLLSKNINTFF